MNTITTSSDQRKRLQEYLLNLLNIIKKELVGSEADLETCVRVESQSQIELQLGRGYIKTPASATLLEILGYDFEDVEDHPTKRVIIGQVKYAPDYILRRKHRAFAIVDLKSPTTNIDHPTWRAQITNYCRDTKLPIGILFNGLSLRVFINVEYPGLVRYQSSFNGKPVASAESSDLKQMIDLLIKLSAQTLEDNPLAVARGLANKRKKEINTAAWRKGIEDRLTAILSDPSDTVLETLASLDIWDGEKPAAELLSSVWSDLKSRPVPRVKSKR